MNNRLKQFLAAENITQAQFADTIKVVRASVSHVLAGRNNPGYDFIKAIMEHYPRLNIEWLMLGKGKMYKDGQTATLPESPQVLHPIEKETTLFEEDDAPEFPENVETDSPAVPAASSTELKALIESLQHPVRQRAVSKIFILFDDGTFQELP